MRSGNPALKNEVFMKKYGKEGGMTLQGTVNKTMVLALLVFLTSMISWNLFSVNPTSAYPVMLIGAIGGLIVALVTIFKPSASPLSAPLYALLEGLFIGGVSASYNSQYGGIVIQAVLITFAVLFSLLIVYKSGWIRVTQNFRLGVMAATGGIFIVYLLSFVGSLIGFQIPFLHDASPIGILISLAIVIVASLNLVLDFDFIERGAEADAPKYMEWYGAFGLMVTLIWLYLEILRLLAKLNKR
ncbi:Bax inhibitor-1/YccA family protein (plasmid) [Pontibacillus sp. ALD_SL1]|uniref:Bax inhibitor-1/YccA family protein n=1 Tax=Pontibacillus sp. ALD_SL1 TaxID=2777185 RepID=UPI001A95A508|nr:Bax inhibitor-1/YccA family protein [Pontibacillus sp. ALD_SL1]QST02660.1 Bax inhibitor-1/YccA family protein [Pontibacillus sp. ALD_SL1]